MITLTTATFWSEVRGGALGQLTPRHAFSPTLTTLLAVLVSLVTVTLVIIGRQFLTRHRLLVSGGAAYVLTMLGLWAGVRLVFWKFAFNWIEDASVVVPMLVGIVIIIAGQFVVPAYLFVNHKIWMPLGWLFIVTWALGESVLLVGGESGGLFTLLVWVIGLLPPCLCVLLVVTGGELFFRRTDLSILPRS